MSRRSGQVGTIVEEGGWYRVRFRIDVPGQHARRQMSIRICPTSGPGLMTRTERERRKIEIVSEHGANNVEHFEKIVAIESGLTFREQAKKWLQKAIARRRKPVKPATIRGWECYPSKHPNPLVGDLPLANVNNGTLKMLVTKLSDVGLGPKTIRNVAQAMQSVVASCLNDDGEEIYPRKWNYEFADVPVIECQHTPMFTGEQITKLVAKAEGQQRLTYILFGASGLRAGELFGLEVKHFVGDTLLVDLSLWNGSVQDPKTRNAYREVDLHPSVAALLRDFIGDRKDGFIFQARNGSPIHQSNFLRGSLHPILKKLGIQKQGFHGFRRFRVTHLESSNVPSALVKYWSGHAKSADGEVVRASVTDKYVKMQKDEAFRAEVAQRIGLGFDLPKADTVEVVPCVPRNEKMEVVVTR